MTDLEHVDTIAIAARNLRLDEDRLRQRQKEQDKWRDNEKLTLTTSANISN